MLITFSVVLVSLISIKFQWSSVSFDGKGVIFCFMVFDCFSVVYGGKLTM